MPKMAVNIGDRYCSMAAVDMAKCCNVKKYSERAVTPKTPRRTKYFLLLPRGCIPAFHKNPKVNISEITERNKTSSVNGRCPKNFTDSCIRLKPVTEINIYFTPLDMAQK